MEKEYGEIDELRKMVKRANERRIDDIVEMILKAARRVKGKNLGDKVYVVAQEVNNDILKIIESLREKERREKKDEK